MYRTHHFSLSCFILYHLRILRAHGSSNLHSRRSGKSQLSCSDQYSYRKLNFKDARSWYTMTHFMQHAILPFFENSWSHIRTRRFSSGRCGSQMLYLAHLSCPYDLKSCLSLQVILMQGTIPAHIDQRGSVANGTLKSNCSKFYWSLWDKKNNVSRYGICLSFDVGRMSRKMNLGTWNRACDFMHRAVCSFLCHAAFTLILHIQGS